MGCRPAHRWSVAATLPALGDDFAVQRATLDMNVPHRQEDSDLEHFGLPVVIPDTVDVDDAAVGRCQRNVGPLRNSPFGISERQCYGAYRGEWQRCQRRDDPDGGERKHPEREQQPPAFRKRPPLWVAQDAQLVRFIRSELEARSDIAGGMFHGYHSR